MTKKNDVLHTLKILVAEKYGNLHRFCDAAQLDVQGMRGVMSGHLGIGEVLAAKFAKHLGETKEFWVD